MSTGWVAINNIVTIIVIVIIQLHGVTWMLRKTEDCVVISHSKLNPYKDDLVYVRVIN